MATDDEGREPTADEGREPTAEGGRADASPPVGLSVTPRENGPLVVEGPVTLRGPDGVIEVADRLFLCRCGGSARKPYCDGTHKRNGFRAPGVPVARKPDAD
jgi:CDGSH-type Zn-finger protein